jgi:hypothetical protein
MGGVVQKEENRSSLRAIHESTVLGYFLRYHVKRELEAEDHHSKNEHVQGYNHLRENISDSNGFE